MVTLKSAYLGIPVSDLEAAAEWYGEHFGFKVVTRDPIFLKLLTETGVTICLSKHDPAFRSHMQLPDGPFPVQGFIVADAEAVHNELRQRGVEVGQLFDYQGQSFSFYDLDGNFIEVWSLPDKE